MNRNITLLFAIAFLLTLSLSTNAQFSRVGGGLSFSTGIENDEHKTGNPGLTARSVIELGEKLWFLPEATFFMPGRRQHGLYGMGTTLSGTVDADVTYTLATEGSLLFYALGGVNMTWLRTNYEDGPKYTTLFPALNLGTGIEMIVEKDINGFAQIRGVAGLDRQYLVISIGVHYYISGRRYRTW